jgi:hypothetical protein
MTFSSFRVPRHLASLLLAASFLLVACGGGGGSGSSGTSAPAAPTLLFAASTGTTALTLQWSGSTSDVAYDVHAGTSADFQPSAQTLQATVQNASAATLTGLQPATSYTLKLVAHRAGAADAAGTNSLTVATMDAPLVPKSGAVVQRDTDIGLTATAIDAASVTLAAGAGATPPPIGGFLVGQVAGSAYVRKVTALQPNASGWVATTQDVKFQDLYSSGHVSYVIAATDAAFHPPAASPSRASRARALAEPDDDSPLCDAEAEAAASLSTSLLSRLVNPKFRGDAGFDLDSYPYVTASASADWSVDAKLDAKLEGTVDASCNKKVLESDPVAYAFLIGPVPFEVGATFELDLGASAHSAGELAISVEGAVHGSLEANFRANHTEGLVFTGSNVPPTGTFVPTLESAATGKLEGTLGLTATLLADGYISIGSRKFHLAETIQLIEVGISAGPSATLKVEPTVGFVKGLQPFQLQQADLDVVVTGLVKPGSDVEDFLSALGLDSSSFEITPVLATVPIYHLPTLALAIGTDQHATGSEVGGVNLSIDPKTIKWAWDSTPPPVTPMPPDGSFELQIKDRSEGCAAISATDAVFGEFGRRYSEPQPYGIAVIDFSSPPTSGDGPFTYGSYVLGGGAPGGSGTFTSLNPGYLLNVAYMVDLYRTDGRKLTLQTVDMGPFEPDPDVTGVTTTLLFATSAGSDSVDIPQPINKFGHFEFGTRIKDVLSVGFVSPYVGEQVPVLALKKLQVALGCGD